MKLLLVDTTFIWTVENKIRTLLNCSHERDFNPSQAKKVRWHVGTPIRIFILLYLYFAIWDYNNNVTLLCVRSSHCGWIEIFFGKWIENLSRIHQWRREFFLRGTFKTIKISETYLLHSLRFSLVTFNLSLVHTSLLANTIRSNTIHHIQRSVCFVWTNNHIHCSDYTRRANWLAKVTNTASTYYQIDEFIYRLTYLDQIKQC